MNDYVISARCINADGSLGVKSGVVSYLIIPNSESIVNAAYKVNNVQEWLASIATKAKKRNVNKPADIVLFIHGFNTTPEESISRQRILEYQLNNNNYSCVVVGFDWASAGNAAGYDYDRFEAHKAAQSLITGGVIPFAMYNRKNCHINIHIVAHSMGGYIVREAFTAVEKMRLTKVPNDWRVNQIAFVAADVSSSSFAASSTDMVSVFKHCSRFHNYFNGYDLALAISNVKNLDISSRVGRVGMPEDNPGHEKAIDIDCSVRYNYVCKSFPISDITLTHAWYFSDDIWVADLAIALLGSVDRNLIPTRSKVGINDFVLTI